VCGQKKWVAWSGLGFHPHSYSNLTSSPITSSSQSNHPRHSAHSPRLRIPAEALHYPERGRHDRIHNPGREIGKYKLELKKFANQLGWGLDPASSLREGASGGIPPPACRCRHTSAGGCALVTGNTIGKCAGPYYYLFF
jgi:hypothetical protein